MYVYEEKILNLKRMDKSKNKIATTCGNELWFRTYEWADVVKSIYFSEC